jgi:ABC-type sulfate/molybdate transport systems ATPase subunit
VSLARAAYCQPDVVLLDDPLSALDAGTAKHVFERLIKSRDAFFSDAAVVLVTHAAHFLNQVDRITVVVDGKNRFLGTWKELLEFEPEDTATQRAVEAMKSSVQEDENEGDGIEQRDSNARTIESIKEKEQQGILMTVEEREHGLSSLSIWLLWFRRAGGVYFLFFQVIFLAIDRCAYISVEYWLARWTKAADQSITQFGREFPPQTDGRSAQYEYLTVYASLLVVSVSATILRYVEIPVC